MFVIRVVVGAALLLLAGLGIAYLVTRNKRYLRIAWLSIQVLVVLLVAFGLLYLFERVLLMV
jgi:hypothetical protein